MARGSTTRGRSAPRQREYRASAIARLRPTIRGVCVAGVAIALVVAGLATGDSALLLVLVIVAVPVIVAPVVVLTRAHRAAGVEVHVMVAPPLVPVGAPCDLLMQVTPRSGNGVPPLSLDHPSSRWSIGAPRTRTSAGGAPTRPLVAPDVRRLIHWDHIRTLESASSTLPLPTRRRGVFTIGPLRLWAYDPFGLLGLTVATTRPVTFVVHPPALNETTPATGHPGWSGSTQFSEGLAGAHTDDPGGEWSGLRPYEPGDRLHLLSWQAEARSGSLLVHDFRPDSGDVMTILLDDRAGVHRRGAFEEALGVVYGLASASEGRATDYDVSTFTGRQVQGSTTPDGLAALLLFLAETQPRRPTPETSPSAVPTPPGGALVITTPTASASLPAALARGYVLVVE
jgi:uncharacterized protein (DUF58 family)